MKNFKLGLVALAIMAFTGVANAGGVGYIDYAKVIDNYDYAKQVTKEVDAKGLEMQQFLVDKEKWLQRKDLTYTGRTLFGAMPPKGQEMDDHYLGTIRQRISAYM